MKFLTFLKEQWNLIASISVAIVIFLTKIIIPPKISLFSAAGEIDYSSLAQFIVIATILILLYPFAIFKTKKDGKYWWSSSVISLAVGVFLFISYVNLTNQKTGYNKYSHTRKIIGNHLLPFAKIGLDSIKVLEKLDTVTPDQIVMLLGEPEENYPVFEETLNNFV